MLFRSPRGTRIYGDRHRSARITTDGYGPQIRTDSTGLKTHGSRTRMDDDLSGNPVRSHLIATPPSGGSRSVVTSPRMRMVSLPPKGPDGAVPSDGRRRNTDDRDRDRERTTDGLRNHGSSRIVFRSRAPVRRAALARPDKARLFSGSKSHRGKSQEPRS